MQARIANIQDVSDKDELNSKYIVYRVANELYASPLASIREVIKHTETKSVPFMVNYYKGVINLRGQIVGIVDLVEKLELKRKVSGDYQRLVLIVETSNGLIGALIDDVMLVTHFTEDLIERNPSMETKFPMEYFLGIAKLEDRLVNLLQLAQVLEFDRMKMKI